MTEVGSETLPSSSESKPRSTARWALLIGVILGCGAGYLLLPVIFQRNDVAFDSTWEDGPFPTEVTIPASDYSAPTKIELWVKSYEHRQNSKLLVSLSATSGKDNPSVELGNREVLFKEHAFLDREQQGYSYIFDITVPAKHSVSISLPFSETQQAKLDAVRVKATKYRPFNPIGN